MASTIHQQSARIGLAMASPVRLRALNLLAQRPWRVSELAEELGESMAATSAHLKVLKGVCMISVEKAGRDVWCHVTSGEVILLLSAAHRAAEVLLPELREAAREAEDYPFLLRNPDFESLTNAVARKKATLIDFRPAREFQAGHIPGAQSWPYDTIARAKLDVLKSQPGIIGYCRGPWCLKARLGVEKLNKRGISAKLLRAGVVEWQAAGLPLARDPQTSGTTLSEKPTKSIKLRK